MGLIKGHMFSNISKREDKTRKLTEYLPVYYLMSKEELAKAEQYDIPAQELFNTGWRWLLIHLIVVLLGQFVVRAGRPLSCMEFGLEGGGHGLCP